MQYAALLAAQKSDITFFQISKYFCFSVVFVDTTHATSICVWNNSQPNGAHVAAHCQLTSCLNKRLLKYFSTVDWANTAVNA